MKGRITSLQRMSVHDGPGIRTVVFLKGCNMRCKWCHNPETWLPKPQLQYIASKCICCGTCMENCPQEAIQPMSHCITVNYDQCTNCGICTKTCCTEALSMVGEMISAEDCWNRIKKDIPYFRTSQGGITISGGEPLLQKDFVKDLLEIGKEHQIHTAIETNLSTSWEVIEELIPLVDLWMCDLKLADPERHEYWTGIDNRKVIANIQRMAEKHVPLIVRTPIVPGVNDREEDIEAICQILSPLAGNIKYELLGFHQLGFPKYENLGMKNELKDIASLPKERFEKLKNIPHKYQL